ncbi:hypothetical protein [Streptomyces sp. DH37]|uniref:hypothetical protein n=1 Tax=Streptomyces sp. DH37 TaxID=3040122 RepID=UPI0024410877|nr:hypothetical protein [Streptomyces sp. DH37]MDG9705187.1 hypothetical protein [Streptomyces sp. DH37]
MTAVQTAARGRAPDADAGNARRLPDKARELIGRAAEHPDDEPPWTCFHDGTRFTLRRGTSELHLRKWRTAVDRLASGPGALPDDHRRDESRYRSCPAHP